MTAVSKEIYNEGRVVGESAFECYVRQCLAEDPDNEPCTEREWLASSIGMGASMLLKIKSDSNTSVHVKDYILPTNSKLCAANTIVASFFYGSAEVDSAGWATKVTDYGLGISNKSSSSPAASTITNISTSTIPTQTLAKVSEDVQEQMMQYAKIQDGVILQPGEWYKSTSETTPYMDFMPSMNQRPTVRFVFSGKISCDFYILLTGFTNRIVVAGETGYDTGSTEKINPQDGDFLGPQIYPWANKIVFTYPGILTKLIKDGMTSGSENLEIIQDEDSTDVTFNVSKVKAGTGIQVNDPSTSSNPAQDITVSAKTISANNFLKVTQTKSDTTSGTEGTMTTLTPSTIRVSGDYLSLSGPSSPGGTVTISIDLSDLEQQVSTAVSDAANSWNAIASILNKIYKGGTLNSDGSITWPTTDKIAIGNLNIYSGSNFENKIETRTSKSANDLRVV